MPRECGKELRPQGRAFLQHAWRRTGEKDCLAERGFEPSRPFISHMLPCYHAHFFSPERKSRRQNEGSPKVVDVKVSRSAECADVYSSHSCDDCCLNRRAARVLCERSSFAGSDLLRTADTDPVALLVSCRPKGSERAVNGTWIERSLHFAVCHRLAKLIHGTFWQRLDGAQSKSIAWIFVERLAEAPAWRISQQSSSRNRSSASRN